MQHPEVLKRAQKEIDTVVGTDRLPTFSDRADLPYSEFPFPLLCLGNGADGWPFPVDAILNETWRWGVPVPLSKSLSYGSRRHASDWAPSAFQTCPID